MKAREKTKFKHIVDFKINTVEDGILTDQLIQKALRSKGFTYFMSPDGSICKFDLKDIKAVEKC